MGTRDRSITDLLGVPPPPAEGRDRILSAAIELFYDRGLQAVGVDQVVAAAGITKTTFYRHFESKDDLMVAAVRRRDAWESSAWRRAVEAIGGAAPRAQLLAFFDVLDVWFNDPAFRGCLFLNTASEFPDPRHPVHRAAAQHKHDAHRLYRRLAEQGGAADPEGFADEYTAIFEGTLILRQVYGRDDAARAVRPLVERLLETHLGPPPPPGAAEG